MRLDTGGELVPCPRDLLEKYKIKNPKNSFEKKYVYYYPLFCGMVRHHFLKGLNRWEDAIAELVIGYMKSLTLLPDKKIKGAGKYLLYRLWSVDRRKNNMLASIMKVPTHFSWSEIKDKIPTVLSLDEQMSNNPNEDDIVLSNIVTYSKTDNLDDDLMKDYYNKKLKTLLRFLVPNNQRILKDLLVFWNEEKSLQSAIKMLADKYHTSTAYMYAEKSRMTKRMRQIAIKRGIAFYE